MPKLAANATRGLGAESDISRGSHPTFERSDLIAGARLGSGWQDAKVMATPLAGVSVESGVEEGVTGKDGEQRGWWGLPATASWASSFSEVEALVSSFARSNSADFDYTGDEVIDSYAACNELITLIDTESL